MGFWMPKIPSACLYLAKCFVAIASLIVDALKYATWLEVEDMILHLQSYGVYLSSLSPS
jgi:hypothetical protein